MKRHSINILSLYLDDHELDALKASISRQLNVAVQIFSASSLPEFSAILQKQSIDAIFLDAPFPETGIILWIEQDSTNLPILIFYSSIEQHKFWMQISSRNSLSLVRDPQNLYFNTAAILLEWALESEKFSQRIQSQRTLQQSNQLYRTIADYTFDWEYWIDPDQKLLYVSPSCERITGYAPPSFQENPNLLLTIVHPPDRAKVKEHIFGRGIIHTPVEFRITTRNGETRWIGHICQPVYDEAGNYCGQRASNRDITEQKHTERILHEQRNLAISLSTTNHLVEALEEVMRTALQIYPIDCSWVHLVGKASRELNLITHKGLLREFTNSIRNLPAEAPYTRRMMQGEPVSIDHKEILGGFEGIQFPPREVMRSAAFIPVKYRGEIVAVLNFGSHTNMMIPPTTRDILEGFAAQMGGVIARTKAEAGMVENLTTLQLLFNTLKDFLLVLNEEGNILFFNLPVQEQLGYQHTELPGLNIQDLLPVRWEMEDGSLITDLLDGLVDHPSLSIISRHGRIIPVTMSITRGKWGEQNVLFCLLSETSHQNILDALENSDTNFQAIARATSAAILIHTDEKLCYMNTTAEKLCGFSAEEILGKNGFEILQISDYNPDEVSQHHENGADIVSTDSRDTACITKDGECKRIHIDFSPVMFNGKQSNLATIYLIGDQ